MIPLVVTSRGVYNVSHIIHAVEVGESLRCRFVDGETVIFDGKPNAKGVSDAGIIRGNLVWLQGLFNETIAAYESAKRQSESGIVTANGSIASH